MKNSYESLKYFKNPEKPKDSKIQKKKIQEHGNKYFAKRAYLENMICS